MGKVSTSALTRSNAEMQRIMVAVRVRPSTQKERDASVIDAVTVMDRRYVIVADRVNKVRSPNTVAMVRDLLALIGNGGGGGVIYAAKAFFPCTPLANQGFVSQATVLTARFLLLLRRMT